MKRLKQQTKVGIPRALSYYTFYPLWKEYLEKLGAEVILSKKTNRDILRSGIKETVNDACIPIKVFHGHVLDLAGRVDYIFLPRMISADGRSTFCPKFLGLPDMVRFSGSSLPRLIDVRYNRRGFPGSLCGFFRGAAKAIGIKNPLRMIGAALSATRAQKRYQVLLQRGLKPVEALDALFNLRLRPQTVVPPVSSGSASIASQSGQPKQPHEERAQPLTPGAAEGANGVTRVALLGYPYAIFDSYISAGVYEKLLHLGVEVITFEQISPDLMKRYSKVMPQNFFWYYSNQVCWAGLYLLDHKHLVDGIIHVTAFGCGPDAMVDKTLELEAKAAAVPFLSLTIDEHTGEGGVQTRLEAFVDMLWAKRQKLTAG